MQVTPWWQDCEVVTHFLIPWQNRRQRADRNWDWTINPKGLPQESNFSQQDSTSYRFPAWVYSTQAIVHYFNNYLALLWQWFLHFFAAIVSLSGRRRMKHSLSSCIIKYASIFILCVDITCLVIIFLRHTLLFVVEFCKHCPIFLWHFIFPRRHLILARLILCKILDSWWIPFLSLKFNHFNRMLWIGFSNEFLRVVCL